MDLTSPIPVPQDSPVEKILLSASFTDEAQNGQTMTMTTTRTTGLSPRRLTLGEPQVCLPPAVREAVAGCTVHSSRAVGTDSLERVEL